MPDFLKHWLERTVNELIVWPISELFLEIKKELVRMSTELDDLTAKVAANTDVIESAITLIQGIKAKLDAAGTDPVALKNLSNSLASEDQKLADAVAANTPAD